MNPDELLAPEPRNNPLTDSNFAVEIKIGTKTNFRAKKNEYMKVWKFKQIRMLVEKMGRFIDDDTNVHLFIDEGFFTIEVNQYTKEVEIFEGKQNV